MSRRGIIYAIVCGALAFAAASDPGLNLTAAIANVSGAPGNARIEILRWSTDEERDALVAAWEGRATAPANAKGKGGGKAGAAGKGKGAPKGGDTPPAAPPAPEASLATALESAATIGYLWASEVNGYAIRYAGRFVQSDGSQRVVLITQRRLGASNQLWNPAAGEANKDPFTVIELRINSKNIGEGRASLTGKVAMDPSIKILTPDSGAPTVFRDVKGAK